MLSLEETMLAKVLKVEESVKPQNPFAQVRIEELKAQSGTEVPQKAVLIEVLPGQWEWVASHSDNYLLVPNERVVQILDDALTRAGVERRECVQMLWNGKKFAVTYEVPHVEFDTGSRDIVRLGVEGVNSYDGSLALGVRFVARRLVCSNGLYFTELLGGFTFRHLTRNEIDFEDAILRLQEGTEKFLKLAPYIRQMKEVRVDLKMVLDWHEKLVSGTPKWADSKTGEVLSALRVAGPNPTLWDLVNAFTTVTSHRLSGFSGSRLSEVVCNHALKLVQP